MSRIILNETSFHGRGSRAELANELTKRNFKKALIVTDKVLLEVGVTNKVLEVLDNAKFPYEVFSNVKENPTVTNVKEGIEKCKKINADVIIAIGGGSVIDTAKAIGIVIKNPEFSDIISLEGVANTKHKALPIIALPTTHGTAAEVTINYVITDEERQIKMVCVDPNDIPIVAIIDSELMETLPKMTAAATGMDALTHAIEGYITKGANELTDMLHYKAIQMIFYWLPAAVNDKTPLAIEKMALAQYIAGMGFSNVGLGIVHSMAHQLGAIYDTPHGIANTLLLPTVMRYNGEVCYEKFREILNGIGVDARNMSKEDVINAMVAKIEELSRNVGITQTIKDYGAKEEDFEMLANKAINDPCTGGNPRDTNVSDIIDLYKNAM